MVTREDIEQIITKSIINVKCGNNYPKAQALKYYNEHKDNFQSENYNGVNNETLPSPVGELQELQARLQEDVEYSSIEQGVLHDYSTDSFIPLGMYLNDVPNWDKKLLEEGWIGYDFGEGFVMPVRDKEANNGEGGWVDMSMPQESEILSSMIDKSPRVAKDSIVYRYGDLPLDIGVGEHGVIKSFQSTSYNEFIAFKDIAEGGIWIPNYDSSNMARYKQRIFVMDGTKGIVLNRHTGCKDWQSELLLDKGMRYVVLDKNDNDMTADILIY